MQIVPLLQQVSEQIAAQHAVDLQRTGAYLRLQLAGHGHLVLENIGAGRVSITNYIPVGNDLVADPEVVLLTDYRPDGKTTVAWTPLEMTQLFGGWTLYAELDLAGQLVVHDPVGQLELASFCEQVLARHLTNDGWLEQAQRANQARPPWTAQEIYARDIRVEEPFD